MLREKLKNNKIILASGSPRRHHFFKEMDIDFTIETREIVEQYPLTLTRTEITDYLSELKAAAFPKPSDNEIIITADTIVWMEDKAIGKPSNYDEANRMLQELSGKMHEVMTSVTFKGKGFQKTVNDTTKVWFRELHSEEIAYYLQTYKPYDKAGSYGIQEWIGYIGIERLEGCYFNVMGLPTRLVYKTLMELAVG